MVSNTATRTKSIIRSLGWVAIVLSAILLLADGASRLADLTQDPPPTDVLDIRYVQHPWITLLHIVPGMLFLTLAPLQFIARIQKRRIGLHRGLGRILATCAVISGLFALVANFRFPAFGGISTQAATVFFGAIFLFSLTKALRHIRRKEVGLHREWMIRTFALAMGVATIRIVLALLPALSELGLEEVFGASFWLGFAVNLLVAEVWIRHTRVAGRLTGTRTLSASIGLCFVFVSITPAVHAQSGPSFSASYDFLPFQNFKDPRIAGQPAPELGDTQIQTNTVTVSASYPWVFSEGRTVLTNEIYYQRREFSYRNFPGGDPDLRDIHAVNYTLMLQHGLSPQWTMLAILTPGFASDFEAEVSSDDFALQVVAIFVRQFSEQFSFGFGAAYSTLFGEPLPLPVLTFDWNNGKNLSWSAILPASSEFWYQSSEKLLIGLVLNVDGQDYHGDPDIYGVSDPRLRYSVTTLGPATRYRLANRLQLNIDFGFGVFHRFEFYDGDDEQNSFNMKPSVFFRAGFMFGG